MKTYIKTNSKFGRLIVIGSGSRPYHYQCQCRCGNLREVYYFSLLSGDTQSCGCRHRELAAEANTTHGKSYSKVFIAWRNMQSRCYDPKNVMYRNYGGRGITVCKRWAKFENFLADMSDPPTEAHTLERIDNDKNYSPTNCRWATQAEQCRNQRRNVVVTWNDRTMILKDWAAEFGVNYKGLSRSVKRWGWAVVFFKLENGIKVVPKNKEKLAAFINDIREAYE